MTWQRGSLEVVAAPLVLTSHSDGGSDRVARRSSIAHPAEAGSGGTSVHAPARPRRLGAVLLAAAVLSTAAPAAADVDGDALPLPGFARLLADEPSGRLFLSPGAAGSAVEVTDLQGRHVATVTGLPGATGMALTPDRGSLWVALPTEGRLARVDTTTLTVAQTVALPAGECPSDVVLTGDQVVYGSFCDGASGLTGHVAVLDPATGTASAGSLRFFGRPLIAAGRPGEVYASDTGLSSGTLQLLDVRSGSPVLRTRGEPDCLNVRDLVASPDGSQVTPVCGMPYVHRTYSADGLALVGQYPSSMHPGAAAWSGDGRTFVGGSPSTDDVDVRIFRAGDPVPVRTVELAGLHLRGLAASQDGMRIWAAVGTAAGVRVRVLSGAGSAIALTVDPPALERGSAATLRGRLTSGGHGVAGASLTVHRERPDIPSSGEPIEVDLAPVTTAADGTFSLVDTPREPDTYTYTLTWAGNAERAGSYVRRSLVVRPTATTLSEATPATGYVGAPLRVAGRLTASGAPVPDAVVNVTRSGCTTATTTTTTRWRGGATTSATGTWALWDPSPPRGTCTYRATYRGRDGYAGAAATDATTVVRRPARLSLALARGTGELRGHVLLKGHLDAWHTNRTLVLTAQRVGGREVVVARGPATRYGNLRGSHRPRGTTTYRVRYAGDDWYRAGTARRTP